LKVLHITNWYPNKINPNEAPWIKSQIESLDSFVENKVIHIELFHTGKFKFSNSKDLGVRQYLIELPFISWFVYEWIYFLVLFYVLILARKREKYDIINFHIAYPMLSYWQLIKRFVKTPIVITEHWSAYHFHFGVNKPLPRIQKIFKQNISVITVSEALAKDIKMFSGAEFPSYVVPNVVDESIFYPVSSESKENFYFMVSNWKSPKTPLLVMECFLRSPVSENHELVIGGYGPLWMEMEDFVKQNDHAGRIRLIGKLNPPEIAWRLQRCKAFLHPSDYETFSVVSAEAVACGAYVIAPRIGGIPEVVGSNGFLLEENSMEEWAKALISIPNSFTSSYDLRFSSKRVGKKYFQALESVFCGNKR
jgi:L-malate glycosyltransferase